MASSLPTSPGKTVPEYSQQDVSKWLDVQATDIGNWTTIVWISLGLIGFVLFAAGVLTYMKEARDPGNQSSGRGGSTRPSITLIAVGAMFGVADIVFILLVGAIRQ